MALMTPRRVELLGQVRDHALANYENGWDVFVEAFTDEELSEAIGTHVATLKGAIKVLEPIADVHEDQMLYAMYPDGLPEDHPKARCGHGSRINSPLDDPKRLCNCRPGVQGGWKPLPTDFASYADPKAAYAEALARYEAAS